MIGWIRTQVVGRWSVGFGFWLERTRAWLIGEHKRKLINWKRARYLAAAGSCAFTGMYTSVKSADTSIKIFRCTIMSNVMIRLF